MQYAAPQPSHRNCGTMETLTREMDALLRRADSRRVGVAAAAAAGVVAAGYGWLQFQKRWPSYREQAALLQEVRLLARACSGRNLTRSARPLPCTENGMYASTPAGVGAPAAYPGARRETMCEQKQTQWPRADAPPAAAALPAV